MAGINQEHKDKETLNGQQVTRYQDHNILLEQYIMLNNTHITLNLMQTCHRPNHNSH